MFEQLFPRFHQRYEAFPFRELLAQFAQWLIDTGYGPDRTREHVRRLRQALDVTRTKVVSPAIDRFRGKPLLFGLFGYNITSISIDLML